MLFVAQIHVSALETPEDIFYHPHLLFWTAVMYDDLLSD